MKDATPFWHTGPVYDPDYFFDRQDMLVEIKALAHRGQNVAVIGPHRIGKTSLLRQLMHPCRQSTEAPIVWVYLDCQGCQGEAADDMYACISEALLASLETNYIKSFAMTDELDASDTLSLRDLAQRLSAVRNVLSPSSRFVIVLDEFGALCSRPGPGEAVFREVLTGLHRLAIQGFVSYITASAQPLTWLTHFTLSSESKCFLDSFLQHRLGLFSLCAAREMLQMLSARGDFPFSAEVGDRLIQLAGPHPLYLQVAGRCAFQYLAKHGNFDKRDAWETVGEAFTDSVASHWRYAWNTLCPEDQYRMTQLPTHWPESSLTVNRLDQAGLVIGDANDMRCFSSAFQAFVGRCPIAQH